ncbi:MAG: hypothetical protein EA422_13230 [Gemmatimonadales bacterium]|nr:MAG: hypothetical protein EA422_13230 [Gemmatimonadales bacterium]
MIEVIRGVDPGAARVDGLLVSMGAELDPPTRAEAALLEGAGEGVRHRLSALGEMPVGGAVVTPGGDLPVEMMIHVVIRSREEPVSERAVAQAFRHGLEQAARWEVERLAVPLLGVGAGNLDAEVAAALLVRVFREHRRSESHPGTLVLLARTSYQEEAALRVIQGDPASPPLHLQGWLALPGKGGSLLPLESAPHGPWAVATAGGKDATLALHRARTAGLKVRWALNVLEGNSGLVRFHGTPEPVLRAQVEALGLEPVFGRTHPQDFDRVFSQLLREVQDLGACGVIFGNLHLTEIRDWYGERVAAAGLAHLEPLWDEAPMDVARSVVGDGFHARVISVNLESGDPGWLGCTLDGDLLARFQEAGIDPCGEQGEYHTLVVNGPGFRGPLPVRWGDAVEREGHRYLELAPAPDGSAPDG